MYEKPSFINLKPLESEWEHICERVANLEDVLDMACECAEAGYKITLRPGNKAKLYTALVQGTNASADNQHTILSLTWEDPLWALAAVLWYATTVYCLDRPWIDPNHFHRQQ